MKINTLKSIFCLFLSLAIGSCKTDEPTVTSPLDGLTKLNEGYAIGASAKIQIWGTKSYFAGYNKLTVVVYDSLNLTQKITDAHISFNPQMTMGTGMMTMTHSAPIENPDETAIVGVFQGAVVFIMPTTTDGVWKLNVGIHNHKYDKEGNASFDIAVGSPTNSVMTSFTATSADASKLFISMVQPIAPKVGINDIEFTIHKKASMMSFPPDSTYTVEITPEMPSMGHGSPNNVNPVSIGNGHYKGKVNFTMTGEWKINLVIKKDGVAVSNGLYFNVIL